jgi:L-seryl-tRNA(Ser) seleniumtransferase
MPHRFEDDPYGVLRLRPFINCCGTRTVHGGSLMLPQVRQAMDAASRQFVNIDELMARARLRIAALTGAEDGIVTAGAAAAITIATAAALVANDPVVMLRLPSDKTARSSVVMLRGHRFPYDQSIRLAGAVIIEIDDLDDLTAIDPSQIAMIAYLASRDSTAGVALEKLAAFGRAHAIPLLVDAASLPIRRPDAWLSRGADLVVYSGGKLLRGPASTGVLLGRRDLIDAAWANSAPHHALGRAMKTGKEEIVGLLTALEAWFSRDEAAERRHWQDCCDAIADALQSLSGAGLEIMPPDEGEDAPMLKLTWNGPVDGMELRRRLLAGDPRIMLDDNSAGESSVVIDIVNLEPGDGGTVGAAIVAALKQPATDVRDPQPGLDVSGVWEIEVLFAGHRRRHIVSLTSRGISIIGKQTSDGFSGGVTGSMRGPEIQLVFEAEYGAAIISYRLVGEVVDGRLAGEATLGSSTRQGRGVVNLGQYGTVRWEGRRI